MSFPWLVPMVALFSVGTISPTITKFVYQAMATLGFLCEFSELKRRAKTNRSRAAGTCLGKD